MLVLAVMVTGGGGRRGWGNVTEGGTLLMAGFTRSISSETVWMKGR